MTNQKPLKQYSPVNGPNALSADGTQELLGRPTMDRYEVFVRECAQNSWDARLRKTTRPRFILDVRELDAGQSTALKSIVFRERANLDPKISQTLDSKAFKCIEVVDRGTSGLDGEPRISAPKIGPNGEVLSTNFRDLIFNVGATRDTDLGGGTYGFGKIAAFLVSKSKTLIYWTRCWHNDKLEYRFIASHIGTPFQKDQRQHIGRHWWGDFDGEEFVPLIGEEAQVLGERIFSHHFEGIETGTNILVLDPIDSVTSTNDDAEENGQQSVASEPEKLADILRKYALVNLWPKMTPRRREDRAPMDIQVMENGIQLDMGDPERDELWGFWADALNDVRELEESEEGKKVEIEDPTRVLKEIAYKRRTKGVKTLGHATMRRGPVILDDSPFSLAMAGRNRSVCLMRAPELVVKYLPFGSETEEWVHSCGVFKASDDPRVDEAFATAENPTHTEWNREQWPPDQRDLRNRVIHALNDLDALVSKFLKQDEEEADVSSERINKEVSEFLGGLLPSPAPQVKGRKPSTARRATGQKRRIRTPDISNSEFQGVKNNIQTQHFIVRTPEDPESTFDVHLNVYFAGEIETEVENDQLTVHWLRRDDFLDQQDGVSASLKAGSEYVVVVKAPAGYSLKTKLVTLTNTVASERDNR